MSASEKFSMFVKLKIQEKNLAVKNIATDAGKSHQYVYLVKDNLVSPSLTNAEKILTGIGETWESFAEFMRAS
jgi:hypothetical protein